MLPKPFGGQLRHRLLALLMLLGILLGYAYILYTGNTGITLCPFKQLSGFPCPGCGMGRSTVEILHGHWREAFTWHPLGPLFHLFITIAVPWLIFDVVRNHNSFYKLLTYKWPNFVLIPFSGIILIIWIRNICLGY